MVSLLLVDDDAVTIDSALNEDAEESVVPDFAVVGAAGCADLILFLYNMLEIIDIYINILYDFP